MNAFERILNDSVASGESTGISARITHKGEDLFRGAAGYADKENAVPMTCEDLIRIFSMTKLVTGVAALQLFEKGHFQLDDPVGKFLPAFWKLNVIDYDNLGRMVVRPAKNILTLRHVFTMTSGFNYHIHTATQSALINSHQHFEDSRALTERILREAAAVPGQTSEGMLNAIASIPLAFEPGSEWLYGVNSDILGGVVEAIAGKSFGEYLRDEIFEPLGMVDTGFRPREDQLKRLAVLYDYANPAGVVPYDANAFNIAHSEGSTNEHFVGALYSTLDDFSAFMQMLASKGMHKGRRILGENTIKLMGSNQLTDAQYASLKEGKYPAGNATWGLMCRVTTTLANSMPFLHPGSFGWAGWAGTQAAVDPINELTLTMMVQRVPSDSLGVMSKLMQTAYGMI